jgi:hypothetical protein
VVKGVPIEEGGLSNPKYKNRYAESPRMMIFDNFLLITNESII